MKYNYLNNLPLDKAKEKYFEHLKSVGFKGLTEKVPVPDACGRIIKDAAYAHICSPHYNASAMDGVAVKAETTFAASERTPVTLTPEDYVVVDTGDPLPENCDAVIMVEDLIECGNNNYQIISSVYPWQNVRQVGEDICMGDMIAPSGTVLTPSLCGALLAGGITEIEVIKTPLVGIIPTGDEIVPPVANPKKGDIIEFNSTVFKGMLDSFNAEARVYPITPDKKDLIKSAVEKALNECDIVLVSAGSSAGRDDYTSEIISSL
nr:molybdopterin biosynthesis protein [Clostridiales bacterium]